MTDHATLIAAMVAAAQGKPDIIEALTAAGFTATEITDNHFEVAERLVGVEMLAEWKRADERRQDREYAADRCEYDCGDIYA